MTVFLLKRKKDAAKYLVQFPVVNSRARSQKLPIEPKSEELICIHAAENTLLSRQVIFTNRFYYFLQYEPQIWEEIFFDVFSVNKVIFKQIFKVLKMKIVISKNITPNPFWVNGWQWLLLVVLSQTSTSRNSTVVHRMMGILVDTSILQILVLNTLFKYWLLINKWETKSFLRLTRAWINSIPLKKYIFFDTFN